MKTWQYLLLAHLLFDYPFQGEFLALVKAKNNFLLFVHATLWTLGICFALDYCNAYQPWMFWWLLVGHVSMDWLKCHKLPGWIDEGTTKIRFDHVKRPWVKDNLGLSLYIDQAWHIFQLLVCLGASR